MQFYLFNIQEQMKAVLQSDEKEIFTAVHTEKVTGENEFDFEVPADKNFPKAEYAKEGNYIGFFDLDEDFQMFEITNMEETHNNNGLVRVCHCEHVFYELRHYLIEDRRVRTGTAAIGNGTPQTAIGVCLAATGGRWELGNVTGAWNLQATNFYYESVLSGLQKIRDTFIYLDGVTAGKTAKGYYKYRLVYDTATNTITHRYVDFHKYSNTFTGRRFEYTKDIDEIKRTVNIENLLTAAYGRGKGEEIVSDIGGNTVYADNTGSAVEADVTTAAGKENANSSYGRRIDFSDIVWTKTETALNNEDMESLTGWAHRSGTGTHVLDSTISNDGGYSIKVTNEERIQSDEVEVLPNKYYSFRCLAYPNNATIPLVVAMDWYNSSHVLISTSWKTRISCPINKWSVLECQATSPATAAYARLVFGIQTVTGGEYAYFDRARAGHRAEKAAGLEYLIDLDATATWGRAGGTIPRMGIFTDDECTDPATLIQLTWQYILDHNTPEINYALKATDLEAVAGLAHEKVRLADLVYVIDRDFHTPINVSARATEIQRDYLAPEETQFNFGNFVEEVSDILTKVSTLEKTVSDRKASWDRGTVFTTPTVNEKTGEIKNGIRFTDETFSMPFLDGTVNDVMSSLRSFDDDGNLVGAWGKEYFTYKKIYAGLLWADNVLQVWKKELEFWVDNVNGNDSNNGQSSGAPIKTFDTVFKYIPRLLMKPVTIHVVNNAGTPYNENIMISGIGGGAILEIEFGAATLNGTIRIESCSCPIWIHGTSATADASGWFKLNLVTTNTIPISVYNCQKVRISTTWINAALRGAYGVVSDSSKVNVNTCVLEGFNAAYAFTDLPTTTLTPAVAVNFNNVSAALCARDNGEINAFDNRGNTNNATYYAIACYHGQVGVQGNRSSYTSGTTPTLPDNSSSISITGTTTAVATPTGGSTPTAQATVSYSSNASASWRDVYNSWRTDNDFVYQGAWGNGNHRGLWFFPSFAAVLGKTIKSATITVQRYSAGGNGAPQNLHLWGHNYTAKPAGTPTMGTDLGIVDTAGWGEVVNVNIPSSAFSAISAGTIKGFGLYDSTGAPYVIMNGDAEYNVVVTIKYNP